MATIIIFEDNVALALHWQEILEAQNHHVHCCSNVPQALALVSKVMPDLIIADMLIKHRNQQKIEGGLTLVARLSLTTSFRGPILGVSGFKRGPYAQVTALDIAKDMGITMALYKPITPEQLLDTVDYLLLDSSSSSKAL